MVTAIQITCVKLSFKYGEMALRYYNSFNESLAICSTVQVILPFALHYEKSVTVISANLLPISPNTTLCDSAVSS